MILFNFNAMGKLCRLHLLLLALLLPGVSFAQNLFKVQGCVTDEQNEPLIGATVQTIDKSKGTITDSSGNYVLSGVPKGSTLVFSYVGYKSKEAKATSTSLNVVLESDDEMLDEVVVIGYGQQRKVTLTGSVSNVGGKELLKSPAASLGNTLSGKLPGLQSVQYTGVPGADDPVIRIRGVGSFNSAEPLVLVDGVEREFSQIDPNEVQDISILKDASATAVFGVRGANGVILVTTRRGEVGKPTITLTASVGLQQISKFLEPANSYEYATAYNHAQEVEGVAEDGWKFSKEAIQHWKDMDMPTVYPSTNWFKYLMDDHAWQEQYNINVSGGTERARYFVSVGMLNQDGLFKTFDQGDDANFKYRRYNFRANLDVDFSKLSTLSIGIGGRIGRRNSIGNGEYNGQSGVFGVEGLLNNGTPMSGYGLDSEGRRIISDPNLVGAVGSDGLGLIYEQGYTTQRQSVVTSTFSTSSSSTLSPRGLISVSRVLTTLTIHSRKHVLPVVVSATRPPSLRVNTRKTVLQRLFMSVRVTHGLLAMRSPNGVVETGMQRRVSTILASSVTTISVRSFFIMNLKTTILVASTILSPVVM